MLTLKTNIDIPTRTKLFKDVPVEIQVDVQTQNFGQFDAMVISYLSMKKSDGRQINRILNTIPEETFELLDGKVLDLI